MRTACAIAMILALPSTAFGMGRARDRSSDVYILAGQSNMSGRGAVAELTPAERVADPRIRLYGNDARWHPAVDPLDDAAGQVDPVSADALAAVGPGLPFARAMLRMRGAPVALLPCAKGGSALAQWTPGPGRDTLYGSCLARTREVRDRPAGLLWYQGETDAMGADAPLWGPRFVALVAAFRRDLRAPHLPVVFVQLADRPTVETARYANWAVVREQQARTTLPCVAMVSASGLQRNADDLHLATDAQRILGARLADAMQALRRKGCG